MFTVMLWIVAGIAAPFAAIFLWAMIDELIDHRKLKKEIAAAPKTMTEIIERGLGKAPPGGMWEVSHAQVVANIYEISRVDYIDGMAARLYRDEICIPRDEQDEYDLKNAVWKRKETRNAAKIKLLIGDTVIGPRHVMTVTNIDNHKVAQNMVNDFNRVSRNLIEQSRKQLLIEESWEGIYGTH